MTNKPITLTKSQGKFLDQAEEIRTENPIERDQVGFSTRMFVQCSLPHSDPGNDLPAWTRTNGNVCLSIQPKRYAKDGGLSCIGYPYGNIPRLILFYVCTKAIQTKSRCVPLGNSLSSFLHTLDQEVTGGRWGTIHRFKDQFRRLFTANIDFTYEAETETFDLKANLASRVHLWWDTKQPEQLNLFNSYIELTEEFINELWTYPVPVDMGIVSAIKQSPLALDLYTWLTYRVVSIHKPTRISWLSIAGQVGAEYANLKEVARYSKEALRKICALWPDLKIEEVKGGIILHPSKPSIPVLQFPVSSPTRK